MKISVVAKPRSKKEYIKKVDHTHYVVAIKEPPVGGKANHAIIKSLAEYFAVTPSGITIISGVTSKQKVFDIPKTREEIEAMDQQEKLF